MFSRLVLLVHRWGGLASCAFLFVVALTGSAIVYEGPVGRMTVPALRPIAPQGTRRSLADIARAAGDRQVLSLAPGRDGHPDVLMVRPWRAIAVNPYTGAAVGEYLPNRTIVGLLGNLHSSLLMGRTGHLLVGIAGLFALLEALTGIIRWWRYKTLWIRPLNFRRFVFELHNTSGFFAFLLVLPLAATGVMISFGALFNRVVTHFDRVAAPVPVVAAADTAAATPDDVVARALAARPGELTALGFPGSPRSPWTVNIRPAGDRSPMGRVVVSIDRHGTLLEVREPAQFSGKAAYWRDGLHAGWALGGIGMALAALGGIALAIQAVTGFLVWWKPRAAPARRADAAGAALPAPAPAPAR